MISYVESSAGWLWCASYWSAGHRPDLVPCWMMQDMLETTLPPVASGNLRLMGTVLAHYLISLPKTCWAFMVSTKNKSCIDSLSPYVSLPIHLQYGRHFHSIKLNYKTKKTQFKMYILVNSLLAKHQGNRTIIQIVIWRVSSRGVISTQGAFVWIIERESHMSHKLYYLRVCGCLTWPNAFFS